MFRAFKGLSEILTESKASEFQQHGLNGYNQLCPKLYMNFQVWLSQFYAAAAKLLIREATRS